MLDKEAKAVQWSKDFFFSTHGAGTTGDSHTKN